MVNWDLYKKRVEMNGDNKRSRQINLMKDGIAKSFNSNPSYRQVVINDSEDKEVQIIDTNKHEIKTILMFPDEEINSGDLIEFDNKKWLCTSVNKENPIEEVGIIQKCNRTLNLLVDGVLHKIPIVIDFRTTNLNVDKNQYLEVPSGEIIIKSPNNQITKNINRDQVYKIGERNNWRINDIDDISEPGLLVMEIEYSQESQPEYEFTIELENNEIELETNSEYQTNATVKVNDETVEDADLVYESSNESIAAVDEDGLVTTYEELGEVEITVRLASDESVYETLGINVVEESEVTYSATIVGSSEITIDTTEEYVCEFKADGSEYEDTAVFYLENIDGEAEIVEEYEDENKVVVKGTSVGKVELYAENSDGSVVSDRFEIDIRSLF